MSQDDKNSQSQNHASNPLKLETDRLENELKVKSLELEKIAAEAKGLKLLNKSMEKAVQGLTDEVAKLKLKLETAEQQCDAKTLELKKANDLRKASQAAQQAAEATVRRLQAAQKGKQGPALDEVIAALEAELKLSQKEVSRLQEDNRAQDRLMRTKEVALLDAEKAVEAANAKAAQVDECMNKIAELTRQLNAQQDENKTLDRMYKQKVDDVKKLTSQVESLNEAVTAAQSYTSVIKDYQRQLQELQATHKITLDELARAKIAATRVASAVANEWKDDNDKVIPVKQWLEERRVLVGEAEKLREKLAHAERATKYEAQMKEKAQTRLKVLEECFKVGTPLRSSITGRISPGRLSLSSSTLKLPKQVFPLGSDPERMSTTSSDNEPIPEIDYQPSPKRAGEDDKVPGALYDVMQREVVVLRKTVSEREQSLKDKDDAIEMLSKKVETLTKAMDVETKKARREITMLEKELSVFKSEPLGRTPGRRISVTGVRQPLVSSTSARLPTVVDPKTSCTLTLARLAFRSPSCFNDEVFSRKSLFQPHFNTCTPHLLIPIPIARAPPAFRKQIGTMVQKGQQFKGIKKKAVPPNRHGKAIKVRKGRVVKATKKSTSELDASKEVTKFINAANESRAAAVAARDGAPLTLVKAPPPDPADAEGKKGANKGKVLMGKVKPAGKKK
ncbi:unnamed protein product [Closterium sp. Yama58-4]|nr:unnamed protein product [Closterium sp. Yama58-4]